LEYFNHPYISYFELLIELYQGSLKNSDNNNSGPITLEPTDLLHDCNQIKYSFVLMLISLSNLAVMGKIQKNIQTKERPVGLININTKEK